MPLPGSFAPEHVFDSSRCLGYNLAVYMPPIENFLASEELKSAGLSENATFQFLLRAGYEQILRSQVDTEMQ